MLAFGDVTAGRWLSWGPTSLPDPHSRVGEAPKPPWAPGFSFGLFLCSGSVKPVNSRATQIPHNLRAAGSPSGGLCFPSGLALGPSTVCLPEVGSRITPSCLKSDYGEWVGAGHSQPRRKPFPALAPLAGLWFSELPGTFHRKEAGSAQHRACFVSPSWWGLGEEV